MLFAKAHQDPKKIPVPEHSLAHSVTKRTTGTAREKRDVPYSVDTDPQPDPVSVLGITQDVVPAKDKHFMVAVAGISPMRVPPAFQCTTGEPVGDPAVVGKCIGYALDKPRWDPCDGSWVVDVHIAHHYQNDAVTTYLGGIPSGGSSAIERFKRMDLNTALRSRKASEGQFKTFSDFGQSDEDKRILANIDVNFIFDVFKHLKDPKKPIDWVDPDERNALNNIGIWWWFTFARPQKLKTRDREVFPSEQSRIQIGHQIARTKTGSSFGVALVDLFKYFLIFAPVQGKSTVMIWALLNDTFGLKLPLAEFMIPQSTEDKYYLEFARGMEKKYFDRALTYFNSKTDKETSGKDRAEFLKTINLAVDAKEDASGDTFTQEATGGSMMAASGDAEAYFTASIAPL